MRLMAEQVQRMAFRTVTDLAADDFVFAFNQYAPDYGVDRAWRTAHFMSQVMHESADLQYTKEVWGPTRAQERYEGRKDLGNTQPGDGFRFRGHGLMHVTGRANTTAFWHWCIANGHSVPNFVEEPHRIAEYPHCMLSAFWYWDTRGLNRYADDNDIENLSVRINGGYNGYADRLKRYGAVALTLLGYGTEASERKRFQFNHDLDVDGFIGPKSRAALHRALKESET